jgi:PAS domain S-box-containing protein
MTIRVEASTETFELGQREILERIASDAPLAELLGQIVALVERQAEGMLGSILLIDQDRRVHHGAAPNLPPELVRGLDGLAIGDGVGSCGTAAFRGQRVIVEDVATHPYWQGYSHLALPYGLRSCWSSPIFSRAGEVLGMFAMYHREPRGPTAREVMWVERATHLASIAIVRHRDEEALRRRTAEMGAVFENAAIGIALVGLDGRPLRANPALQAFLGYPEDELRGMSFDQFTYPADVADDVDLYRATATGQRDSYQIEKRYLRKTGEVVWGQLTVSMIRDGAGQPHYALGMVEDITARRQMEDRIQAQAALLDRAKDAILVRDVTGVISYWNKGAERLFGWSRDEAVGRPVGELLYRDPAAVAEAERRLLERGEWTGEMEHLTRTGREVTVEASWTLIRDERGEPKSILAINSDVTEKKRLEAQVLRVQRMESLGTMAGGIAHDFNNVLTAIMANVTLALGELPIGHPARESLAEIENASTRAGALVRQILTFSRKQEPNRQVMGLEPVVGEALRLLRATLPATIQIRSRFDADVPLVLADPTQVHQVVMNLGTNASHAMERSGGTLDVRGDRVVLAEKLLAGTESLPPGTYARLVVADTGAGMDGTTLERIFDPFFTTKEPGKGTGLGLSVVHGVMRSHDGGIVVSSAPGYGSQFSIYFPAAADAVLGQAVARATVVRGDGERILCIDDEPAIVRGTTMILRRLGYTVIGETDAIGALRSLAEDPGRFDAVVTDCSMPGVSGPDLARALLRIRPGLPIVVTSGRLTPEDAERLRQMGVHELVPKPSSIEDLSAAIHRALNAALAG